MNKLNTISGYLALITIATIVSLLLMGKVQAEDNKYFTVKNAKKVYKVVKDKEITIKYNNSSFVITEDTVMWTWKKVF